MKTKERLQTTLDRLPYGPEGMPEDQKVSKKLPEGVRSRELYEDIVRIAGPSFVELLLTQLTSMVDLMMVGSMGGTENLEMGTQALAAVGLTTQPKFLLMAAFVSMNTGVTALVARNRGRGDQEKANLVVRQGLLFTFWATVLMSILGVVFARPMVIFMGSTEETVTIWATQYLQIQMAGFLTMALTSTITASLRAVGDSKTCMIYNMIANGVNVCFNWLLIYGNLGFPALGVAGASIATVIGQFVAFAIAISVILKGNGFLKLEFRKGFKPDRGVLGDILNIGLPAMVEQLLMRAGIIIYAKTVASLGTVAYATHQVCMNIQALSFMTGQAFAVSATTLMGAVSGKTPLRYGPGLHEPHQDRRLFVLPDPGRHICPVRRQYRWSLQQQSGDHTDRRAHHADRGLFTAVPELPVHRCRWTEGCRRHQDHGHDHLRHSAFGTSCICHHPDPHGPWPLRSLVRPGS